MGKRTLKLPSLKTGTAERDIITVYDDVPSFADGAQACALGMGDAHYSAGSKWNGGVPYDRTARLCRDGDLTRVPPSDEFMRKMEGLFSFETSAFKTVNAMCGGAPNVPAMLAGVPLTMRRRERVHSEQAPLNVVVALESSGGIDSAQLARRGAVILALVRILSGARPVTLWGVVCGKPYGSGKGKHDSSAVAFRFDTAPLDLARAAHLLSATGIARQLGYAMISEQVGDSGGNIDWAFGDVNFYRANGARYWERALGLSETLFIASPFVSDETIATPEKWLKEMLAKYGRAHDNA